MGVFGRTKAEQELEWHHKCREARTRQPWWARGKVGRQSIAHHEEEMAWAEQEVLEERSRGSMWKWLRGD